MDYNLLVSIPLILTVLLMLSQILLIILFIRVLNRRQLEEKPIEQIIEGTRVKSASILHKAMDEANRIIVSAELEGIKELSKQKFSGKEVSIEFRKHLEMVEKTLQDQSDRIAKHAEGSYTDFIGEIEKNIHRHIEENKKLLEERSNTVVDRAQGLLDKFIGDVEERVKSQVDDALKEARNEISEYKAHRIKVIDERIIDMLEEIIKVALEKKLSLAEQSELVYRALEEAKRENSFVNKQSRMEVQELKYVVIRTAYTKADIQRRLRLLREYLEQTHFAGEDVELTKFLLSKRAQTDDIDAFLSWGKEFFDAFTKEKAYTLLNVIAEHMKTLPVISMYIPYEPVPAEVNKLGAWIRRNVGELVLIDLHTDPTLLGGCAFAWKGTYRDYSLRYYMQKKRDEITKIIEQYVSRFY